jgi:hypothetical protein
VPGSGVVTTQGQASSASAMGRSPKPKFVDNGGAVLHDARIQLIFWGSAWSTGTSPTMEGVTAAVSTILSSTYTDALRQYREAGVDKLAGAIIVATSEPPNPCSSDDVAKLIFALLDGATLPGPEADPSLLHCVILPAGVAATSSEIAGAHSAFAYYDVPADELPAGVRVPNVRFAWAINGGTLDSITTTLSHELVESCTDPDGDAFQGTPGTCAQPGWCEIGDVCSVTDSLGGVRVQSYWSEQAGACVVPVVKSSATSAATPTTAAPAPVSAMEAQAGPALTPGTDRLPAYLFWIEIAYLVLLLVGAGLFVRWDSFRQLFPDPIGPVPLGVAWFGALGAVTISLYGMFRYSRSWDGGYNYGHLAGPLTGAVTGVVGFLIFAAIVNATGVQITNRPIAYVIAFLLGYRQESFRELIKKATDLLILPGLKADGGPASPSEPGKGPNA